MQTEIKIIYQDIPSVDLDKIQLLWEQLKAHHHKKSRFFKYRYEQMTFDDRKKVWLKKEKLYIDTAKEDKSDKFVGYCVSSIDRKLESNEGEIESILVTAGYQELGIGKTLMERGIEWLESNNAESIKIAVAGGNEEVFSFYEKHGFFHFSNILMQRKPFQKT
jgi:ribosomal protein S18 acetylase RimI-like enzyme